MLHVEHLVPLRGADWGARLIAGPRSSSWLWSPATRSIWAFSTVVSGTVEISTTLVASTGKLGSFSTRVTVVNSVTSASAGLLSASGSHTVMVIRIAIEIEIAVIYFYISIGLAMPPVFTCLVDRTGFGMFRLTFGSSVVVFEGLTQMFS